MMDEYRVTKEELEYWWKGKDVEGINGSYLSREDRAFGRGVGRNLMVYFMRTKRKHIRLRHFDYSSKGEYFCCHLHVCQGLLFWQNRKWYAVSFGHGLTSWNLLERNTLTFYECCIGGICYYAQSYTWNYWNRRKDECRVRPWPDPTECKWGDVCRDTPWRVPTGFTGTFHVWQQLFSLINENDFIFKQDFNAWAVGEPK